MISILEEAMTHIDELEIENEELRAEIERLKARNLGGRKRHNAAWMASYQEFAIKYEAGMTIMEIVKEATTISAVKTHFLIRMVARRCLIVKNYVKI